MSASHSKLLVRSGRGPVRGDRDYFPRDLLRKHLRLLCKTNVVKRRLRTLRQRRIRTLRQLETLSLIEDESSTVYLQYQEPAAITDCLAHSLVTLSMVNSFSAYALLYYQLSVKTQRLPVVPTHTFALRIEDGNHMSSQTLIHSAADQAASLCRGNYRTLKAMTEIL